MKSVQERFLRYVSFDTKSDEASATCPSTAKQKLLGAAIVEEMKAIGIADAYMDEHGYVYGTVPGDPTLPTIGLIAHMDTSPDNSGANVQAKVIAYAGFCSLIRMRFAPARILLHWSSPPSSSEQPYF